MKLIEFTKDCGHTKISIVLKDIVAIAESNGRTVKIYTATREWEIDGSYKEIQNILENLK